MDATLYENRKRKNRECDLDLDYMQGGPASAAGIATSRMPQNAPAEMSQTGLSDTETIDTIDSVANIGRDPVSTSQNQPMRDFL